MGAEVGGGAGSTLPNAFTPILDMYTGSWLRGPCWLTSIDQSIDCDTVIYFFNSTLFFFIIDACRKKKVCVRHSVGFIIIIRCLAHGWLSSLLIFFIEYGVAPRKGREGKDQHQWGILLHSMFMDQDAGWNAGVECL